LGFTVSLLVKAEQVRRNITIKQPLNQNRMKKETLEEAAEKYAIRSFDSLLKDVDDHFIAGAKWQQEQMEQLKDFDTWKEWKNKQQ
jgi:hypothetical protein